MSIRVQRPESLQFRVFRASDAIGKSLLTPDQLRSSAWMHVRYDVYADSRLEVDHGLACRAVMLGLPPRATIAGPSAAFLWGVGHAAAPDADVHVIAPPPARISPRRSVRIHATALVPADRHLGGLSRTSPARTAFDVAAWLPPLDSVPVLDSMLAEEIVDLTDLVAVLGRCRGRRGSRRAAIAFSLADGAAQSVPESRLRVRFVLAGLPRPVVQLPVLTARGVLLHPDLAWADHRVAVEYDGQWHGSVNQLDRDRRRLNLLVADGWLVLHVTSERMRRDFAGVLREVKAALAHRGWRG